MIIKTIGRKHKEKGRKVKNLFIAYLGGSSSVGRVIACHAMGREFESRLPLQIKKEA